jgi:hypothetical protein
MDSKKIVCVLNLALTSNLLRALRAPDNMHGGRKIYNGSGRTSLRLVIGGLRYRHN